MHAASLSFNSIVPTLIVQFDQAPSTIALGESGPFPKESKRGLAVGSGKAMGTIKECYAYCNATKGCKGFVWDEIPGEISGQCKGKHGQGRSK